MKSRQVWDFPAFLHAAVEEKETVPRHGPLHQPPDVAIDKGPGPLFLSETPYEK
jgi:hypothetical protein